jgi:hypothetical protein
MFRASVAVPAEHGSASPSFVAVDPDDACGRPSPRSDARTRSRQLGRPISTVSNDDPQPGDRTDPGSICVSREIGGLCLGRGEVVGGVLVVMDGEGCDHDPLAVWGDAVEADPGNFGDQPVSSELDD